MKPCSNVDVDIGFNVHLTARTMVGNIKVACMVDIKLF